METEGSGWFDPDRSMSEKKRLIVYDCFVFPAKQDHILAIFCHKIGFMLQFYSSASQSIEKLLKASLLLNGKSAKSQGHDLVKLFREVEQYASNFFPNHLNAPAELKNRVQWANEPPVKFLERIKRFTSPDAKYGVYGWSCFYEDIFKMNNLILYAMPTAYDLDEIIRFGDTEWKPRDELLMDSEFRGDILSGIDIDPDTSLRDILLRGNFCFAPKDYDHGDNLPLKSTHGIAAIEEVLASNDAEWAQWVVDNIKLPDDLEEKLKGICNGQS